MDIIRRTLFASDTLNIGVFAARPVSDACGEIERQDSHVVVLPVSGVFSRHDAPGRHVTGTPSGWREMPDWWIPAPGSFGRPKLALAVEPEQIRWRSRPGLRAITSLPVTASAATAQDLEHVPFRGNRNVL